ncbi:MAG: response regulator [Clostridia bacterium]|nr:response regulator [Clostridia bacterium]
MFKVMIVDDMEIMRKEMKRLKIWGESSGFVIAEEAGNGQEALEKLKNTPIALVITDIKMPKVDGIELLRKTVENELSPCVVLLSDYSEFSYAKQGLVFGAFDYLVKPINEGELRLLLQRVKAFLLEKQQQNERLKTLEEKLNEKIEMYFPAAEVSQITEFIKEGNDAAIEAASAMADVLMGGLDNDFVKTSYILKKVICEILDSLRKNEDWLPKFIRIDALKNTELTKSTGYEEVKEEFLKVLGKITEVVHRVKFSKQNNNIVNAVCKYALENVDGEISLRSVAEALFMNKTHISEVFKQKTGVPLVEYLSLIKVERAKFLMAEGKLKTYEIAETLGFLDAEYFSKLFKKYTGTSPSEFRKGLVERS